MNSTLHFQNSWFLFNVLSVRTSTVYILGPILLSGCWHHHSSSHLTILCQLCVFTHAQGHTDRYQSHQAGIAYVFLVWDYNPVDQLLSLYNVKTARRRYGINFPIIFGCHHVANLVSPQTKLISSVSFNNKFSINCALESPDTGICFCSHNFLSSCTRNSANCAAIVYHSN